LITYSVDNMSLIPKNQGIYAFYINMISPAKIGLIGNEGFSNDELLNAKKLLIRRFKKYLAFIRSDKLVGNLVEEGKAEHVSRKYSIIANGYTSSGSLEKMMALSLDEIYKYAKISELLSIFAQPIYVGITTNQTLFDRYIQHKNDFEYGTDKPSFGLRMRKNGLDWDDLLFSCVELGTDTHNKNIISALEKQLQSVSMPLLSVR